MKLSEIIAEWGSDCIIDPLDLGGSSQKIAQLHHKYLSHYIETIVQLKKLKTQYDKLWKLKWEYYLGYMTQQQLQALNLEPFRQKILKSDVDIYINGDDQVIELKNKISVVEEKVSALESILKIIHNRGFVIKGMIDWERFKVGG